MWHTYFNMGFLSPLREQPGPGKMLTLKSWQLTAWVLSQRLAFLTRHHLGNYEVEEHVQAQVASVYPALPGELPCACMLQSSQLPSLNPVLLQG